MDAVSIVTEVFPEFDERQPIRSVLQQYPQIRWHEVNCDRAWALSEPWEQLPVTDDPVVAPTLPMNLQVMEYMQQLGFGLIFDGTGGDELFEDNLSLQDLGRAGNWLRVIQILRTQKRWYSTLWRGFGLPHLPKSWQSKWVAVKQRKFSPIPPWINPAYTQKPQTQAALQQYFEAISLSSEFAENFTFSRENSGFVGAMQVFRLLGHAYHLEYVCPLLDQRLVEFALHLPPILQSDLVYKKIFLRQTNRGKLPEDVLWRPKENYFDPLLHTGLTKGYQAVALLKQIPFSCLQEIIDVKQVEVYLNSYRQGQFFRNNLTNKLYALLALVNWCQRIEKYYV